jgi:hypothetical protein
MIFGFAILATALLLSAVAAWYSVAGLTAIFSAAAIPVIIMGGSLELGKIVATVWLHNNWKRVGIMFKLYLIPAIAFLMILTSMGIFGYLSKAHSDQSLVSGDSMAKVAIYDEKIKTAKDNIDANRKALKQMDEAVDQVMGRSSDEKGADKAVQIRRSQQKERVRLQSEIQAEQKTITALSEESAPLRAEFRKVEAEVGPIKYIAALVYGDSTDQNVLEKAVRFVIIMIVLVFDPLALTLILAANKQFEWARKGTGGFVHDEPKYEPDDGPLSDDQIAQIQASAELPKDPHPPGWMFDKKEDNRPWNERYPYLAWPFVHFKDLKPMVAPDPVQEDQTAMAIRPPEEIPGVEIRPWTAEEIEALDAHDDDADKEAIRRWKLDHPDDTIKGQRTKLARGQINQLPWTDPKYTQSSFGSQFPLAPNRGDTFVKIDRMPPQLYKFNGDEWIIIDKNSTDNYTYDIAYVDHLIEKITTGEYDPDLLSDIEREQVAERLKQTNTNA